MIKIEFTKEFAQSKKGDTLTVHSILASKLIKRGVAKEWKQKRRTKELKVDEENK